MFPSVESSFVKSEAVIAKQAQVKTWLVAHGWGGFVNQFHSQAVSDLDTLFALTQDDLRAIGLSKIGDRRRLATQLEHDAAEYARTGTTAATNGNAHTRNHSHVGPDGLSTDPNAAAGGNGGLMLTIMSPHGTTTSANTTTNSNSCASNAPNSVGKSPMLAPGSTPHAPFASPGSRGTRGLSFLHSPGSGPLARGNLTPSHSNNVTSPNHSGGAGGGGGGEMQPCDMCDDAPAAFHCKQCGESYCASCDTDMHSSNPAFRSHRRAPVASAAAAQGSSTVVNESLSPAGRSAQAAASLTRILAQRAAEDTTYQLLSALGATEMDLESPNPAAAHNTGAGGNGGGLFGSPAGRVGHLAGVLEDDEEEEAELRRSKNAQISVTNASANGSNTSTDPQLASLRNRMSFDNTAAFDNADLNESLGSNTTSGSSSFMTPQKRPAAMTSTATASDIDIAGAAKTGSGPNASGGPQQADSDTGRFGASPSPLGDLDMELASPALQPRSNAMSQSNSNMHTPQTPRMAALSRMSFASPSGGAAVPALPGLSLASFNSDGAGGLGGNSWDAGSPNSNNGNAHGSNSRSITATPDSSMGGTPSTRNRLMAIVTASPMLRPGAPGSLSAAARQSVIGLSLSASSAGGGLLGASSSGAGGLSSSAFNASRGSVLLSAAGGRASVIAGAPGTVAMTSKAQGVLDKTKSDAAAAKKKAEEAKEEVVRAKARQEADEKEAKAAAEEFEKKRAIAQFATRKAQQVRFPFTNHYIE